MCFFQFLFLIYFRILYIRRTCHSFLESIWFTIIFSLSNRVTLFCSKYDFLEPCLMEGPIKSLSSVCISISSSKFLSGIGCYFFQLFYTMVDIWNIYKQSPFSQELHFSPNLAKYCPLDRKIGLFGLFEKFCH